MAKIDVTIDLETTSTNPVTGRILSIGAVAVVRQPEYSVVSEFYSVIGPDQLYNSTEGDSEDTLQWWYKQDGMVFEETWRGTKHIYHVMEEFRDWFNNLGNSSEICVWGNGPSFDISFLENKAQLLGMDVPWKFYNVRCARTIADLARSFGVKKEDFQFEGRPHIAIDDARHEAKYIHAMMQAMKGEKQ